MAVRLWTALLLLVGVVAMHGWQCSSAPATSTQGSDAVHAVAVALTAPTDATHMAGLGLTGPMPGGSAVTGSPAAEPGGAGHSSPPHGPAGHLWTLCLAVLAAGLAILLALLAPRLLWLLAPTRRRARARATGWFTPLRPPDLAALCLLRI
jgi:hypothetical protein